MRTNFSYLIKDEKKDHYACLKTRIIIGDSIYSYQYSYNAHFVKHLTYVRYNHTSLSFMGISGKFSIFFLQYFITKCCIIEEKLKI